MVASRQVQIPFYKSFGGQRGWGFGALPQIIGRTAVPFLRKYFVPAEKCVGADLLDLTVEEVSDVVSGRKIIKTAAKSEGRKTLRKQFGSGSSKMTASKTVLTNSAKRTSPSPRDTFTNTSC